MPGVERRLVWSAEAEADLDRIWDYLASEATLDAADRRLREIGQSARRLRQSPFLGKPRDELAAGLRSLSVPRHVIFYRVAPTTIEVARVIDARRDIDAIFRGRRG